TTLKEIGTTLGLSPATVSRALNGFPEVNQKTRELVQETAKKLNYRPNRLAQKLVTGRSGMVGMIVRIEDDMSSDPFFFEIIRGLSSALASFDVDLVLAVDQHHDPITPYERLIEKNTLDGFILNAPRPDDMRIAFLKEKGVPFVMHGQAHSAPDYPFYDLDNALVSGDAVALLADLGHRRIALLNGDKEYAFAVAREDGFKSALAKRNLKTPDAFIQNGDGGEEYGYSAGLACLAGRHGARPTALICASTLIAAGVLRAARDLKLNVPQDVSVIAHDDAFPILKAINLEPALTVTRAPLREACAPLAKLLVDHIKGAPVNDLQQMARAEVIIRNSTGPVPNGEAVGWQTS
ncbi:UNVERIFIED_CONTAM: hypothetical protein GTU68_018795, partial [Idotea baltica]|nr:hypothetical protein [Idotea baltica]